METDDYFQGFMLDPLPGYDPGAFDDFSSHRDFFAKSDYDIKDQIATDMRPVGIESYWPWRKDDEQEGPISPISENAPTADAAGLACNPAAVDASVFAADLPQATSAVESIAAPPPPAAAAPTTSGTDTPQHKRRFERTRSALQQSGLLDITMNIADMVKDSQKLDDEVAQLRKNSQELLKSILNNPQNSPLRAFLLKKKRERETQDV
ncbi:hypothetical protein CAPTEDRAFT_196147 [Capitella teleta]|uniref:Uncharacterized protein n=1 Tax=Capitella teleta TaxID=283909 RepID=R7U8M2_CAPTE|nr:hypothetical protein CAPTEDRAFT_196147 [Capitella teleta]|eukprot:ELT99460.1 hypothetical protein CAPTEDRAFT_196147 [Capitella teleta]